MLANLHLFIADVSSRISTLNSAVGNVKSPTLAEDRKELDILNKLYSTLLRLQTIYLEKPKKGSHK